MDLGPLHSPGSSGQQTSAGHSPGPRLPSTSLNRGPVPLVQTSPAWRLAGLPLPTWGRGREWVVGRRREGGCQDELGGAALCTKASKRAAFLRQGQKPRRRRGQRRVDLERGNFWPWGVWPESVVFSTFLLPSPLHSLSRSFLSSLPLSCSLPLPQSLPLPLGCRLQSGVALLLWPNPGAQGIPPVPPTPSPTFW